MFIHPILRKIMILLFLVMTGISHTGCDKYARYRVLKFFFDGVPNPYEQPKLQAFDKSEEKQIKTASQPAGTHPTRSIKDPCSFCHESSASMLIPAKDLCIKCHGYIRSSLAYIHPPAATDCFICHDVHNGVTTDLLKVTGDALCCNCHYPEEKKGFAKKSKAHKAVADKGLGCLICHDPHGGNEGYFLTAKAQGAITDNTTIEVTKN